MAIAFDTKAGPDVGTTGTTHTISYTITGSNPYLLVFIKGTTGDNVSAVSWNGVSMVQVAKQLLSGVAYCYAYSLKAPATGTHNVIVTKTNNTSTRVSIQSYSGVSQSSDYDSFNTGTGSGLTVSTTVVATGCWLAGICILNQNNFPSLTSNTRTTRVDDGFQGLTADSNGTVATGSQGWTVSNDLVDNESMIVLSFAPVPPTSIKTINGLGVASVKTVNGLAIASVKTWNGLA